jgi:hypothetical protein
MKKIIYSLLLGISLSSCNDLISESDKSNLQDSQQNGTSGENFRIMNAPPIPSYPLDWANSAYFPHPSLSIRAPWQAGASTQISNDILGDYKPVDGWELAYSTFSSTATESPLFFALYNKFRGLLRVYYFSKNDISTTFSDNLVGILRVKGTMNSTTPVLNFSGQTVIDVTQKQSFSASLVPFKAAANTWYAFEYELAYDPNMSSRYFSEVFSQLDINGMSVTSVNLDGTIDGEVTGSMANSSSLSISPNFSSPNTVYNNSVIVNGNTDADRLKIGSIIKNGIKSGLTSGLSSLASNILSGLFSKTSSNSNVSKMNVNLNTNVTGTLTSNIGIQYPQFPFVGTLPASGNGVYADAPGVFNLAALPTIKVTKIHQRKVDQFGGELEPDIYYSYEVVHSSVSIQWNPDVVPSLGTISNLKYEVVLRDVNPYVTYTAGQKETAGSLGIVTGQYIKNNFYPIESIGVRISYKFTPANGSNPVFNVKTFKATEISENVYLPPVGGGEEDS